MREEFEKRVLEINNYYEILENIMVKDAYLVIPLKEDNPIEFDVDLQGTLKSASILLLYNLMEFTVIENIEEIHNAISDEKLVYGQISDEIQKLWLNQYYEKFKETSNNHKNILTNLKLMVDTHLKNNIPVKLDFTNKDKRNPDTSGNIDARKIRSVAEKYGINFQDTNLITKALNLKKIKDKRNSLAHGNESFLEVGSNITFPELKILKEDTVLFLDAFIDSVEHYITNKNYKNR